MLMYFFVTRSDIKEISVDAQWGKKLDLAIYQLSLRPSYYDARV